MLNIINLNSQVQFEFPKQRIVIIDESHLHYTHKQYKADKAYLLIRLEQPLHTNRLSNHRLIYRIVERHCPIPIHALRIEINQ